MAEIIGTTDPGSDGTPVATRYASQIAAKRAARHVRAEHSGPSPVARSPLPVVRQRRHSALLHARHDDLCAWSQIAEIRIGVVLLQQPGGHAGETL